jgi:hypothetical protein
MRHRFLFSTLPLVALFLALVPSAMASNTWYVDGVNGSDNNNCKSRQHACKTIGHAISLASSGDSIMVAAATYTENLTIGFSLKIVGSGASTTIIDGGGVNRVVTISSGAYVTLSKLTIRNGHARGNGAGIDNQGTLTINASTISGNYLNQYLHFCVVGGGGINNSGTLTINNSTITGNNVGSISGACGGGIENSGTLTINTSTITGNNAGTEYGNAYSGGIAGGGTLTINNSTVSGNSASSRYGKAYGGGIAGPVILQNSIVANNGSAGNCYGIMTSNGYNLSSDNTCNFNGPGDLNNTDPKLGQLGNYGGPTQTMPLLSGSPAIDAGNPSGCTDGNGHLLKTDQRGRPRPDKEDSGGCDMGAYERQKD